MATSKIIFYRTEITPERNACIDDIQQYLTEKSIKTYEADNFQYQKLAINQTVTIAADQEKVGDQSLGNYCDIFQDNRHFYFFIINVRWTSSKAVKVDISMDTINTFAQDLEFTKQTKIIREHEDRFRFLDEWSPDTKIGEKTLVRLIDKELENVETSKILTHNKRIKDKNLDDLDWYLVYKTRDDLTKDNIANPISCSLVANKELTFEKGFSNLPAQTIYPNQVTNEYYYFDPVNNPGGTFDYKTETSQGHIYSEDNKIYRFHIGALGAFVLECLYYDNENGFHSFRSSTVVNSTGVQYITFTNSSLLTISGKINGWGDIINNPRIKFVQTGNKENATSIPFSKVDKTDSKLMKIIRLPYCPIDLTKEGEFYKLPANWELHNGMITLKSYNLSDEFLNAVNEEDVSNIVKPSIYISPKSYPSPFYESKMYNSQFYNYKFTYDSFSHDIRFEDLKYDPSFEPENPVKIGIQFKPTNTVNSNFAFGFIPDLNSEVNYTHRNDYENFMIVKRNNEETIFSNDYINYIRNGYNYDKKARDLGLFQNILGIMPGLGNAAAAIGLNKHASKAAGDNFEISWLLDNQIANGGKTTMDQLAAVHTKANYLSKGGGGSPFLSAAAISAGASAAAAAINTAFSYQSANLAMQQKQQEYSQQATNVQGSDDVDLLTYYNGNRLELKEYKLDNPSQNVVHNLFHYSGYSHPFQHGPNTNSRYWFNYVQCEPVFKNEHTSVYSEYLDDIKIRFNKGVTYFHHHPEIDDGWDIEQKYENWEKLLLDTKYLPSEKITSPGISSVEIVPAQFGYGKNLKYTINPQQPLDETYQAIEVKYTYNGHEIKAPRDVFNKDQFTLNFWTGKEIIYIRRANIMDDRLSSDWVVAIDPSGKKLELGVDSYTFIPASNTLRYHIRKPLTDTEWLEIRYDHVKGSEESIFVYATMEEQEEVILHNRTQTGHIKIRRVCSFNSNLNSDWHEIL